MLQLSSSFCGTSLPSPKKVNFKVRYGFTRHPERTTRSAQKVPGSSSRRQTARSQPASRGHTANKQLQILQPQMLGQQPSLLAPMTAFMWRLSYSLRRMLPHKGLRRTLSSKRLGAKAYLFADVGGRRSVQQRAPAAMSPAASRDSKLQRSPALSKAQPSTRASGIARSSSEASLPLDSSPATAKSKSVPFLAEATAAALTGVHKPVGMVLVSAHTLATMCHLSGQCCSPFWPVACTHVCCDVGLCSPSIIEPSLDPQMAPHLHVSMHAEAKFRSYRLVCYSSQGADPAEWQLTLYRMWLSLHKLGLLTDDVWADRVPRR